MNRLEINYIKDCYERMLAGTYDPTELQQAYFLITKVSTPIKLAIKKNTIYAFMNYQYSSAIEQLEEPIEKAIAVMSKEKKEVIAEVVDLIKKPKPTKIVGKKKPTRYKPKKKVLQSSKKS